MIAEMWAGQGRATREQALAIPGVLRARNIVCGVATWPLVDLDGDNRRTKNPLLEQIDPNVANVVTKAMTFEDLFFEGISWWRIVARDKDNFPIRAEHIAFSRVTINPPGNGEPADPLPSGEGYVRRGEILVDGQPVNQRDMKRFDSPNPGVLRACGATILRAATYNKTAAMYADNPRAQEFFRPTEGVDPVDDDEVGQLLDAWEEARKTRSTAYVPAALTREDIDVMTPVELQLVELQRQAALDVANACGLDPEDLGISTTSRTYANDTDRRQDRINDLFSPYTTAFNERLSMGDITRRGHRVYSDPDTYLRADPLTRVAYYQGMASLEAFDAAEARQRETLPPLTRRAVAPAATATNVVPIRGGGAAGSGAENSRLAASGGGPASATFSAPLSGRPDLFTAAVSHSFGVDVERRTIRGLAVPYGPDAISQGKARKYRFERGSIVWPSDPSRVKLLVDHVFSSTAGAFFEMEETDAGLMVAARVAAGPDGDAVLFNAAHKIRDGLSVGVDFVHDRDTVPDPLNPGVWLVKQGAAVGVEISNVAVPSFDTARVLAVAASRNGGPMPDVDPNPAAAGTGTDPNPPQPQPHPGPPPAPAGTFTLDQLPAILQTFTAMQGISFAAPAAAGPTDVDPLAHALPAGGAPAAASTPATAGRATVTRDPAPYRFDRGGNLTPGPEHDFSTDLCRAGRENDGAAYKRALTFMREMTVGEQYGMARHQFDIDRADLAGVNPTRNRPDLYVDQRDYRYPLTQATRRGTLADVTAFTLPKFNSASGLTGAHTEGVEPTSGVFTVTTQTITPTAKSGAIDMTREAWDQGGSPQASALIWRQFDRSWNEALENGVATFLNTLTAAADIALGAGVVNKALAKAWNGAIARLQFARGGADGFDVMAAEQELYVAMATAETDDGDPIFPMIGPVNRQGTSTRRFRTLDAAGVEIAPAWALASTAGAVNNSWLFDSETVHTWDTGPQRLEFPGMTAAGAYAPVAYVRLAVWGYQALANTDINGVRQVTYDTVA